MTDGSRLQLAVAGTISLAIGFLQFAMYFGGPEMYRWCGTPEPLVAFRVSRPVAALFVEVLLAAIFATFAAYAYSGAEIIRPLPWLAEGLVVTTVIYLLRGAFVIPQLIWRPAYGNTRDVLYSCIALAVGLAYGFPTYWHFLRAGWVR